MRLHLITALLAGGILFAGCQGTGKQEEAPPPDKPADKPPAATPAELAGPFQPDKQGFILNWLMVGPFPNPGERPDNKGYHIDYLKEYGGELTHVPASGMEIAGGGADGKATVKWQVTKSDSSLVDFFSIPQLKLTDQMDDVLVYCACWVELEKDADVEVRLGSDDAYKLWIDHKFVGEAHEYRAADVDQESWPRKLTAGKHLVLLKVDQDWGGYEFYFRIVTKDGKAIPGLKVWN